MRVAVHFLPQRARRGVMLGALAAVVALAGCAGRQVSSTPQRYDLGADTAAAPTMAARAPVALSFAAAPTIGDGGMVWRIGDSASPQTYATVRWAAAPADLVRQRLIDRLSRQGPVVTETLVAGVPQLRVTVARFEQVFAPDGASSRGEISLQALLVRDRTVIAQTRIDEVVAAPTQDAAGGVAALRVATTQAGDALAVWLARQGAGVQGVGTPGASGAAAAPAARGTRQP